MRNYGGEGWYILSNKYNNGGPMKATLRNSGRIVSNIRREYLYKLVESYPRSFNDGRR